MVATALLREVFGDVLTKMTLYSNLNTYLDTMQNVSFYLEVSWAFWGFKLLMIKCLLMVGHT